MKKSIFILFSLLLIGIVSAAPHGFTGFATHKDGENIPDGYIITAGINGIITGSEKIFNGFYESLVLESNNGGMIEFFVNGQKMDQEYLFSKYGITHLNLTIDEAFGDFEGCGDDVCSLETNECSFCAVDCSFNECSGNGVCDEDIGETCSTSPEDCGTCPPPGNGGGGGNSGGGGGNSGGGSGGGGGPSTTTSSNDNSSNQEQEINSIDELNEEEQKETTNEKSFLSNFFSFFTGSATGSTNANPNTLLADIFIILIVGLLIFAIFKKKTQKDNTSTIKATPIKKTTKKKKKSSKKKISKKK